MIKITLYSSLLVRVGNRICRFYFIRYCIYCSYGKQKGIQMNLLNWHIVDNSKCEKCEVRALLDILIFSWFVVDLLGKKLELECLIEVLMWKSLYRNDEYEVIAEQLKCSSANNDISGYWFRLNGTWKCRLYRRIRGHTQGRLSLWVRILSFCSHYIGNYFRMTLIDLLFYWVLFVYDMEKYLQ